MLSILCDSIGKFVQAFDDCVVHAFPGTTIERLTFKLERQPKLVRNAAFVLLHVGTNDVCYRTRSPAIIHQLFELLVNQILSIVPNARILMSSNLPRSHDFYETNDKIHSINNDLEHNPIRHTVFIRTCGPFLRRSGSLSTNRCKVFRCLCRFKGRVSLLDLTFPVLLTFLPV